jgi:hypothetical protein
MRLEARVGQESFKSFKPFNRYAPFKTLQNKVGSRRSKGSNSFGIRERQRCLHRFCYGGEFSRESDVLRLENTLFWDENAETAGVVRPGETGPLFPGFDFYAAVPFDFFSAMYFFMARRFFCLLRLCKFFRASCFMLILLVRRDKPAGCLRMRMPLRDGYVTA